MSANRRGSDGADVRVAQGWRRALVGDELERLLAGQRALTVREGRLQVDELPG